jgi:peptidoglycan/LPS O-acetylase OafA/YrhL
MNANKYQWLDLLRGGSALLVCANHLRAAMFVDYSSLQHSSIPGKFFYFITGLGAESVVVFFVLSGFFVGGSVIRKWQDFSYSSYLTARLARLWVVLLPALLWTFVIDQVIFRIAPGIFAGADLATLNSGPGGDYSNSLGTFLQNLAFLQTVSAPVFGSNGPLWSLSNEFWYYVCFPLLCFVFDRKSAGPLQLAAGSAVVVLGLVVLEDKMLGFLLWILGAAVYYIPRQLPWMRAAGLLAAGLPLFVLSLVMSKSRLLPGSLSMAFIGVSASMLILALRGLPAMPRLLGGVTEWLTRASYTLYLVHFPLVLLVYAACFKGGKAHLNGWSLLLFVGLLLSFVAVAQVFWALFEKHTDRVKAFLGSPLRRMGSASASARSQPHE